MSYVIFSYKPSTGNIKPYEYGPGYNGPLLKRAKLKLKVYAAYAGVGSAYEDIIKLNQARKAGEDIAFTYVEYVSMEDYMATKAQEKKLKQELKSQIVVLGGKEYTLKNVTEVTDDDDCYMNGVDDWKNGDLEAKNGDMILHLKPINHLEGKKIVAKATVTKEGLQTLQEIKDKVQEGDTIIVARDDGTAPASDDDDDEDEED